MVQTSPTPFDVGRAFVHQYYTLLHQAPHLLHRFYSTDSTFIHGGVDRPGSIEQPAVGPEDIARRIDGLSLRDCHAKIRQVDSHPTIGNGVVVQVTGELSNNGDPMRRFMQTFVLAPRQPKKYYVQNDIFRYQDEVFDDGSDEDDGSSSQIYGDTDKVSNADSSAAGTQPLPLAAAPPRPPVEEPQHAQLPPRNTGSQQQQQQQQQQQVIPNQPARQQQQPAQPEIPINGLNNTVSFNGQQQQQQPNTQESQQPAKPTTAPTEGASYAGIAKLNSSTGVVPTSTPPGPVPSPPVQQTNTTRPVTSGKPSTNQQRGGANFYQNNSRGAQWADSNAPYDQNTGRRSGGNSAVSNGNQVFVGSLPAEFTNETLVECFSQFGHVREAKIRQPSSDGKKNYGFVVFEDSDVAASVVQLEHVEYQNVRLNIEPKTQKNYQGNANNGAQGGGRNNYPSRNGVNRGGGRGGYRGNGNNPRRSGGSYYNKSSAAPDENYKVQQQQQQPQQQ